MAQAAVPQLGFKAADLIQRGLASEESLEDLKRWVKADGRFPVMSDEQFILFLISCDSEPNLTRETVKCYFKYKNCAPEMFNNRNLDAEDLKQAIKVTEVALFPTRTKDNSAVLMARLQDPTYYNFILESAIKYLFVVAELPLYSDNPPQGYIMLFDMKDLGLMHLTRIRLGAIKKFFHYLQEGLPCKLKSIHVFNVVPLFDKILAIIKPFMKKELLDMLILHRPNVNMDDFYEKHVPKCSMPLDYGGDLPTQRELYERTLLLIEDCREVYAVEEHQRSLYKG